MRLLIHSDFRYSDGNLVFWNKGDTAFIEVNGKKVHENCELKKGN